MKFLSTTGIALGALCAAVSTLSVIDLFANESEIFGAFREFIGREPVSELQLARKEGAFAWATGVLSGTLFVAGRKLR